MHDPLTPPRLSLPVKSADPLPETVVLEDLRTGQREQFDALQALAARWLGVATLIGNKPPGQGEKT